tara:strand:+ start:1800 stop:1964 length:165 start_codon:yes stop_codon:yes gene_type:complete
MAIIRLNEVEENVSNLLKDAADRVGMKKHAFINQLLDRAASREYAMQQVASSKE